MEYVSVAVVALVAAILGAAAGYFFRHQSAQRQQAESAGQIAKLMQIRKAASERIAQQRDQIVGSNKTIEELRRAVRSAEADRQRRESLNQVLDDSPFATAADKVAEDGARKGPPTTFADTQVLGNGA